MAAAHDPATVVLVHGSFLGPWSFEAVTEVLSGREVRALAVRLASSMPTSSGPAGDLHNDVHHVCEVIDSVGGPVLLCGHSYGGAVITEAAAKTLSIVTRLVYLAAAVPDAGESLTSLAPITTGSADQAAREAVRPRPDGMIELDPDAAREALFHDCTPERAEQAIAQLTPTNPAISTQPVRAAAWHHLPVTYVRGTADRMPELLSATFPLCHVELCELPTGHCPNYSRPVLVGDLLATRAIATCDV